jgi:N-methylhydantoinase B
MTAPPLDPVTFEILKNGFRALCNESSALIARVSYAPTITEGNDLSGALLTADARLVAHGTRDQAPHIGGFEPSIRTIVQDVGEPRPGDVYIFNDPYSGGAHVNDVKIIRPIFLDGALFAFAAHTGHWPDVGGALPGSFNPRATDCYSEGLRLPPLRLMADDRMVPSTLKLIQMNMRCGAERLGDIHAQVEAGRLVERRLKEYVAKFGADTIRAAFEEIMAYTERMFRHEVGKLPEGRYEFVDHSDCDHMHPDRPRIRVHCALRIEGGQVTFDFTRSDAQPRGPFGFPRAALHSAVYDGTLHCFSHLSPLNHGLARAIRIQSTPGTCVDILEPTPASGYACGAYEKVAAAVMACWGQAFASVNPRRIYAAGINLANLCLGGVHPKTKAPFVSYLWNEGGQGARSYKDGNSFQLMIFIGGATNQPVEVLERWYPVVFERCQAVQDSCGDGKFRGGLGIDRSFRADGEITLTMHGDRAECTPFGLGGGTNGGPNVLRLGGDAPQGRDLGMAAYGVTLRPGDRVIYRSNGGGGYADPLDRDPALVLEDVLDEWISLDRARDVYGVAIVVHDWETLAAEVDRAETERLRAALRRRQRPRGLGPGQVHPHGEHVKAPGD